MLNIAIALVIASSLALIACNDPPIKDKPGDAKIVGQWKTTCDKSPLQDFILVH